MLWKRYYFIRCNFSINNISCYTVLDIHYYKGQDISKSRYIHKYQYIKALLSNETNNDVFLKDQVIVGCPVLVEIFKEAIDHARSLPYDVYGIGCIQLSYSKCKGVIQYTDKSDPIAYFRVKPQIDVIFIVYLFVMIKNHMALQQLLIIKVVL